MFQTFSDDENKSNPVLSIKLLLFLPLIPFQLFMTCKLYGTINEKVIHLIIYLYLFFHNI